MREEAPVLTLSHLPPRGTQTALERGPWVRRDLAVWDAVQRPRVVGRQGAHRRSRNTGAQSHGLQQIKSSEHQDVARGGRQDLAPRRPRLRALSGVGGPGPGQHAPQFDVSPGREGMSSARC